MAAIGLAEAARLTGRNPSTIHRAMKAGRLSYTEDPAGERRIDVAELERVFGVKFTVVRQAFETARASVSSGGHSSSYWCQQRQLAASCRAGAFHVREMLLARQKEYLIELGDAVVAVKDANGRVKLNQLFQPVAAGAVSGMLWGSLIGLLFMMPLAGAAVGAASGALKGRLTDLGINDDFMKQTARTLQSGNAVLFLLIRKMTTDKVLAALHGAGGTVMRSSFDETKEEALQAAWASVRAATSEAAG